MMFKRRTFILFSVFQTIFYFGVQSQPEVRNFDSERLQEVVDQYDLEYRERSSDDRLQTWFSEKFKSIISQIFEWLSNLLRQAGVDNPDEVAEFIFYSAMVLIIVFTLFRLFKMKPGGLFQSKFQPGSSGSEISEMKQNNFEKLIEEALNQQQLKDAIRYYYLFALQKLQHQNLIEWGHGKTNHEYLRQLGSHPAKPSFEKITHLYEYIWYGDFPVKEPMIKELQESFSHLNESLHAKAFA